MIRSADDCAARLAYVADLLAQLERLVEADASVLAYLISVARIRAMADLATREAEVRRHAS